MNKHTARHSRDVLPPKSLMFGPDGAPQFILPKGFDADALLPPDMKHRAEELRFVMSCITITQPAPLNVDFIDRIIGRALRVRLIDLLLEKGQIIKFQGPKNWGRKCR